MTDGAKNARAGIFVAAAGMVCGVVLAGCGVYGPNRAAALSQSGGGAGDGYLYTGTAPRLSMGAGDALGARLYTRAAALARAEQAHREAVANAGE